MNLNLQDNLASEYKSLSQKARVITEAWGEENLFCPNCQSTCVTAAPANTQAIDYVCPICSQVFELKSRNAPLGDRILDSGYDAMMRAVNEDRTPNLFALHYDRASWQVRNLILIPHFAFSSSAIEARNPLSSTARRAGWVGCFIVLKNIPADARISIIVNGTPVHPDTVRQKFLRISSLRDIKVRERGWMLDVLQLVRSLKRKVFTNSEIYEFAHQLAKLHPDNRHIRDKIRQQLQFLRDRGFLVQSKRGAWALKE